MSKNNTSKDATLDEHRTEIDRVLEFCSKLPIETLKQGVKYVQRWRRSGVFIVKFEHISHLGELSTSKSKKLLNVLRAFNIRL